jgi:hypothetical protein
MKVYELLVDDVGSTWSRPHSEGLFQTEAAAIKHRDSLKYDWFWSAIEVRELKDDS